MLVTTAFMLKPLVVWWKKTFERNPADRKHWNSPWMRIVALIPNIARSRKAALRNLIGCGGVKLFFTKILLLSLLTLLLLSQFEFLSFVTTKYFWVVTIWAFEFCHNLSLQVLSKYFLFFLSSFQFLTFVKFLVFEFCHIWVLEFCHNFSFWDLSQF